MLPPQPGCTPPPFPSREGEVLLCSLQQPAPHTQIVSSPLPRQAGKCCVSRFCLSVFLPLLPFQAAALPK